MGFVPILNWQFDEDILASREREGHEVGRV